MAQLQPQTKQIQQQTATNTNKQQQTPTNNPNKNTPEQGDSLCFDGESASRRVCYCRAARRTRKLSLLESRRFRGPLTSFTSR